MNEQTANATNLQLPDFLVIPSILIQDKDLQPLDGQVYGIVYWFSKLKNEKCTASNATIGKLLGSHPQAVSHCLARLAKKGYVELVLSQDNQRAEIIPNISFTPRSNDIPPISIDLPPYIKRSTPPRSNDLPNKNNRIRILNNIKEKERDKEKERSLTKVSSPPLKYPILEDLTDTDFQDIATKYQVPIHFVRSKYDDMMLWAGERPGNTRLRGRNWKLTLMKWVKTDAFKLIERSKGDPTKRVVDARNL